MRFHADYKLGTYHNIHACLSGFIRILLTSVLIPVILLVTGTMTVSAAEKLSERGKHLLEECERLLASRNYNTLSDKGKELSRLGESEGISEEKTAGDAFRLYAMLAVRDTTDFTPIIEPLIKKAPQLEESSPKIYLIVTRTIASYYQRILNDYSQALLYATKALETSRRLGDKNAEAMALSVLASIYFQKQDPTGWSYAVDSYNMAYEHGDNYTKYVADCNLANYLYNKREYEEAMSHLLKAKEIARQVKLTSEESYLNSFLGDVYSRLGNLEESEKCYLQSLEAGAETSNYDKVYSRICYALFLVENKRLDEALSLLFSTKDMAEEYKVTIFNKHIYSLMSRVYEDMGDLKKSLDYYKGYTEATLTEITEQKEREFAILDLRNRVSEEERKNASQSLELMKRGRTILILTIIGGAFLMVCIAGYFYHRRMVRDYKDNMQRYLDNAKSERLLREQLEAALSSRKETKTGSLGEEKQTDLYMRLDKMLREDKIYRDSSMSLSKAAEILSTNRTYLSQVVNEKAGKSFSTFINEYRLNEAVELLSDPLNTKSLKQIGADVGFTSPSNFYMLFKQKVGVSPSVFRDNIKNLENDSINQQNDIQN